MRGDETLLEAFVRLGDSGEPCVWVEAPDMCEVVALSVSASELLYGGCPTAQ